MSGLITIASVVDDLFKKIRTPFEFSAPLLLRIYLAPIFILAGYGKLQLGAENVSFIDRFKADPNVVAWFGNPDWGLGLPAPDVLAFMAGWTEFLGGWLLVAGLLTRYIAIPLMVTMIVAATTAHWDSGWHALPESKLTVPWEWKAEAIEQANIRKEKAKEILKQHGNYEWLTEYGGITILKNGIEFAATYFLMLLALMFMGAGKVFSIDYWIARKFSLP